VDQEIKSSGGGKIVEKKHKKRSARVTDGGTKQSIKRGIRMKPRREGEGRKGGLIGG